MMNWLRQYSNFGMRFRSTNIGLKATHGIIRKECTLRQRLHLVNFSEEGSSTWANGQQDKIQEIPTIYSIHSETYNHLALGNSSIELSKSQCICAEFNINEPYDTHRDLRAFIHTAKVNLMQERHRGTPYIVPIRSHRINFVTCDGIEATISFKFYMEQYTAAC